MTLNERVSSNQKHDDYLAFSRTLLAHKPKLDFDEIWNLALAGKWDGQRAIASFLPVLLDISPSKSLKEFLNNVMNSPWDLSNQVLPFYLVSQFAIQKVSWIVR